MPAKVHTTLDADSRHGLKTQRPPEKTDGVRGKSQGPESYRTLAPKGVLRKVGARPLRVSYWVGVALGSSQNPDRGTAIF
jgi:hypothetical protein